MTFVFCCPNCGSKRSTNDSVRGRQIRCPACHARVVAEPDPDAPAGVVSQGLEQMPDDAVETAGNSAAQEEFDPYYQWLGIPTDQRPPDHYQLVGVKQFEGDLHVIEVAADRQMLHIKSQATGRNKQASQALLNEVAKARGVLVNARKKAAYDKQLKARLRQAAPQSRKQTTPSQPTPTKGSSTKPEPAPPPVADQATEAKAPLVSSPPVPAAPDSKPWRGTPPPASAERAASSSDDDTAAAPPITFSDDRADFESEMDMTPMVDVTFLLLIFFMVTASFSMQKSLDQPIQKQDEPSTNVQQIQEFEDNPDYVMVQIDEFDTFRVITEDFDEEAPSEQELMIMLLRARQGGSSGRIPTKMVISAHSESTHGRVVMANDAGSEVGMEQVQVVIVDDEAFY